MKTYELACILSPAANPEETAGTKWAVEKAIQDRGGAVLSSDQKLQTLAYAVQSHRSGRLLTVGFQIAEDKLPELQKALRSQPNVLRHLVVVKKQSRMRARRTRALLQTAAPTPRREGGRKEVDEADLNKKLEEILGE